MARTRLVESKRLVFFREALRRLVSKRQGGGRIDPRPCQDVLWKMPCQGEGYLNVCDRLFVFLDAIFSIGKTYKCHVTC